MKVSIVMGILNTTLVRQDYIFQKQKKIFMKEASFF